MDLTASGSYARYTYADWVQGGGVHTATAFHLQGDFALAPKIGENLRFEAGLGLGAGREIQRERMAGSTTTDIIDIWPLPTASVFVGLSGTLSKGNTTIGGRWHFAGLGTGMTFAVRHGPVEAFLATQVFPSLSGIPNGTAGLMVLLPIK